MCTRYASIRPTRQREATRYIPSNACCGQPLAARIPCLRAVIIFWARLRWRPGTNDYYLEANAEPALCGPATPVVLLLRPRAAMGSTWAASTQPLLTATLSSRALGPTTPGSITTISLSNGQTLMLSQHNGLLQGPPVAGTVRQRWHAAHHLTAVWHTADRAGPLQPARAVCAEYGR